MENITIVQLHIWNQEDDGRKLLSVLQQFGVLPKVLNCPKGHGPMELKKWKNSYWWYCDHYRDYPKRKPKRVRCQYKQSIKKDTFFNHSCMSILQICQFINLWLDGASLKLIGKQCGIQSYTTRTDWASFCREVLYDTQVTKKKPIGGVGMTVEIDESKFGKRKYNRGHRITGQWVFGGVCRETGDCFMIPVEKRDRATLLPIIRDWILPGTRIVSDYWKTYDCLADEGYRHLKVNHSLHFVDPETGACINKIEASWRAAKQSIESSGRRKAFYNGYLAYYMFQKKCKLQKLNPFVEFMRAAGELYDPRHPDIND